jgi:hypothetical protein
MTDKTVPAAKATAVARTSRFVLCCVCRRSRTACTRGGRGIASAEPHDAARQHTRSARDRLCTLATRDATSNSASDSMFRSIF